MAALPPSAASDAEAQRQAELLTSRLFGSQFLVAFDLARRWFYVSPQCSRVLGYPAGQVTAELLRLAIHPDDRPLVMRAASLTEEFGRYLGYRLPGEAPAAPPPASCACVDYRLRRAAGAYVRVLRQDFWLAAPAEAEQEYPPLLGSVYTDITGHKTTDDVRFSIDHPEFAAWIRTRKTGHTRDPLSLREQEILARMLAGGTNADMSKELFISELTLKTHRRNIHRKLKGHALALQRREAAGGGAPAAPTLACFSHP